MYWVNFDADVLLAIVHSDDATNHLRYDHHVPEVRLHSLGLLSVSRRMFGLAQFLEQGDRFPLDATAELPPQPSPKKGP